MLSMPSTTDVLVNGKEEQEKTWNPLVHWHEEIPGGLSLGSQGSLEPAVCVGVFMLLAAAHMTSTQFLSCCHQSLRLTREALGQHRQNQLYTVLPSSKLMRGCRNCCIKYLVWTSVSFTALSECWRIHKLSLWSLLLRLTWGWAQSRLCSLFRPEIKHLGFKWRGIFLTRHRFKTEIVCRRECQLGLYFARRVEALS